MAAADWSVVRIVVLDELAKHVVTESHHRSSLLSSTTSTTKQQFYVKGNIGAGDGMKRRGLEGIGEGEGFTKSPKFPSPCGA